MEIALYIRRKEDIVSNIADISFLSQTNKYGRMLADDFEPIKEWLIKNKFRKITHIYFGSEFCEKRIDSIDKTLYIANFCKDKGYKFTFVTPPMTNSGLQNYQQAVCTLMEEELLSEIVVNDIGFLYWLHERFKVKLTLGRTFDKISHDGRVGSCELKEFYGDSGISYASSSGVFSDTSQLLFHKLGVSRFDMDLPNIPIEPHKNCHCSVYLPYSFLTTGRRCMIGSVDKNNTIEECSQLCRNYNQLMIKTINEFQKEKQKQLLRNGNTVYYKPETFQEYISCFDRVVLERQI